MNIQVRFRWAYVPPGVHLLICLVALSGYIIPKLQFLGILWTVITVVDLPLSIVTIALAWKYSLLAGTWAVIAGTWWWYFLGEKLEAVLNRRQPATKKNPNPPDKRP